MKLRLLSALAVAGVIVAGGVAAPAMAVGAPTITALTPAGNLVPGQSFDVTVSTASGDLCDNSYTGSQWAIVIAWYYPGADIQTDSPVAYSPPFSPNGSSYTHGVAGTYTQTLEVPWINDTQNDSDPTYNGDYEAVAFCTNDGETPAATETPSSPYAETYQPVEFSSTSVEQGAKVTVTLHDLSGVWCEFGSGPGYSMGMMLSDINNNSYFVPVGVDSGGPGEGSFNGDATDPVAEFTIPTTVPAGVYTAFLGCIGPASSQYDHPGPGMTFAEFEVTAAVLPDTGVDSRTVWGVTVPVAGGLLMLGAAAVFLRRRLTRN